MIHAIAKPKHASVAAARDPPAWTFLHLPVPANPARFSECSSGTYREEDAMRIKSLMGTIEHRFLLYLACAVFPTSMLAQQTPPARIVPATRPAAVASPPAVTTQRLPLRRIVLYKSGVRYFEHDGQVRGNQDIEIDLTGSQLNDILKSLTALDLNGGRIAGARYNSQDPSGHELASLPVSMEESTNLSGLLEELRGSRLEARNSGGAFRGRLLSVDEQTRHEKEGDVKVEQISLLSDDGEVRSFPLGTGTNLRFTDPELERVLLRALGLMDSSHQEDIRHLVLSTTGTGNREVRVSYTSEVPVWKTTYRIILPGPESPAASKPMLQGWAVVDNTVGEDWNDVELSLAAGAPQSFVQELSQPYYIARAVVPMPRGAMLMPQTHAGTLSSEESEKSALRSEGRLYQVGSGGGLGAGTGGGAFRLPSPPPAPPPAQTQAVTVTGSSPQVSDDFLALAQSINAAQGNSLGDLFEYKAKDRVTIRKNQSALVPIVQTDVKVEKVSLWNAGLGTPRPLRALWLTNISSLVLDGGSFNVVDGGAFGGEGLLDSIQPGEKRLISYAADLGMQVVMRQDGGAIGATRVTRVHVGHGAILRTIESLQRTIYTLRNEDASSRAVILEHPVRPDWKLSADLKPQEQSASAYRFRIEVPSKETKTLTVEETRPIVTQVSLSNLTQDQVETFVTGRELTPEIEASFREIVARKDAIAKLDADLKTKRAEVDALFQDQGRLRENMKALKGTPEEKALAERYTGELGDQETRLAKVRGDIVAVEAQKVAAQQELSDRIEKLTFDAEL